LPLTPFVTLGAFPERPEILDWRAFQASRKTTPGIVWIFPMDLASFHRAAGFCIAGA
jgi:hypothetical protein